MAQFRPASNKRPGDQSSETPSGKRVPMAMSMMVDSMVKMIQKAKNNNLDLEAESTYSIEDFDEN